MKLDGHLELDFPPTPSFPATPSIAVVRIARWLCMAVWLIAGAALLACVFPPTRTAAAPQAWFLALLGIMGAMTLSTSVLKLCDERDARSWTKARIRQLVDPIRLVAFGLRRRGCRS